MSSRDAILQRVRSELAKGPPVAPPPVPEVWPRRIPTPAAMAEQFAKELAEVHGEVIRCATMRGRAAATGRTGRPGPVDLARRDGSAAGPRGGWPICRRALAATGPAADWQPQRMAELSASVVEADVLLADTGSCLIACPTAQDRLLCYLPPACVVIARADQLAEHLPAAWATIAPRVADPALRGEFVIVTGPSRTADIEKILILGVHGPKRLVVLLVG